MQSHLRIGRIILAVSICVFELVECSPCRGWTGVDGYCLDKNKVQRREQISEAVDSHHCSNLTKNENYHPCAFSSQSCVLIFLEGGWVSGCVADNHGLFVQYSMNSSNQLVQPNKGTYSRTLSVGSFCATRKTECDQTSVHLQNLFPI
ncbi:hypothetical protein PENTCL1PPCAC_6352 [Pristionchus entomophagus]|uniref:Secreted protein n=1 Tax=Pristionchus entomophagus TaxID=358040 RepID=A0AAV5SLF1_9BILA|nr:hypothetical protein PENTCL1PPCAC_6352 [Pristionchus entomophagus]